MNKKLITVAFLKVSLNLLEQKYLQIKSYEPIFTRVMTTKRYSDVMYSI